jgi:hypothetical protein
VNKYGRVGQATDDHTRIIRRMHFACWITKATNTHSECVIGIDFRRRNIYANDPQYYVHTYISFLVINK